MQRSENFRAGKKTMYTNEVPYTKQKCISVRWICSLKETDTGVQPKARLVARGFEESTGNLQKDSPTCSKDDINHLPKEVGLEKYRHQNSLSTRRNDKS